MTDDENLGHMTDDGHRDRSHDRLCTRGMDHMTDDGPEGSHSWVWNKYYRRKCFPKNIIVSSTLKI